MTQVQDLQVTPAWGGLQAQVSDTPSTWPAALLAGLGAPWNTLQPEGALTLKPQQLRVQWLSGRWMVQGGLTLTAQEKFLAIPRRTFLVFLGRGNIRINNFNIR